MKIENVDSEGKYNYEYVHEHDAAKLTTTMTNPWDPTLLHTCYIHAHAILCCVSAEEDAETRLIRDSNVR